LQRVGCSTTPPPSTLPHYTLACTGRFRAHRMVLVVGLVVVSGGARMPRVCRPPLPRVRPRKRNQVRCFACACACVRSLRARVCVCVGGGLQLFVAIRAVLRHQFDSVDATSSATAGAVAELNALALVVLERSWQLRHEYADCYAPAFDAPAGAAAGAILPLPLPALGWVLGFLLRRRRRFGRCAIRCRGGGAEGPLRRLLPLECLLPAPALPSAALPPAPAHSPRLRHAHVRVNGAHEHRRPARCGRCVVAVWARSTQAPLDQRGRRHGVRERPRRRHGRGPGPGRGRRRYCGPPHRAAAPLAAARAGGGGGARCDAP
jgi:hypothetical protein